MWRNRGSASEFFTVWLPPRFANFAILALFYVRLLNREKWLVYRSVFVPLYIVTCGTLLFLTISWASTDALDTDPDEYQSKWRPVGRHS